MSEVVADFIYKMSNPLVKQLAANGQGHKAYINSFKSRESISEWPVVFKSLMTNYEKTYHRSFTFEQLELWCASPNNIQSRYLDITLALYYSLINNKHFIRKGFK